MLSLFWMFIGGTVGLLITAVFRPSTRSSLSVPYPHCEDTFQTKTGCVKFQTEEVPCSSNTTSLNIIASQHK